MSTIRQHFVFVAVLLVTLLGCAGIALPYPILAPLFMDGGTNGLNSFMGLPAEILLGIALAVYPFGILIGSAFIGALSDSYGRKKVLVWTLFISIIGYFISAYAIIHESFILFIASRFFTGLCEGNVAIARAIALDLGETIDKTRAMSLISAATFLGWFVGPLAGGYLAVYGSEVAFEAGGIAIGVCMVLAMLAIKETNVVENDKSFFTLVKSHNSFHLLKHPILFGMFIFQLCFTLGLNAFYEFYPVWLVAERDFVAKDIGHITATLTVFMTLTSLFVVTGLKNKIGIKAALVGAMLTGSIFMGILPQTDALLMLIVFALTGVCISIYNGLLPVFISDTVKDVGNGALMGLITVTFCIANTVIALVGSYALQFGAAVPMYMGCVFVFLSAILLAKFMLDLPDSGRTTVEEEEKVQLAP